jgi:hypothetical protein
MSNTGAAAINAGRRAAEAGSALAPHRRAAARARAAIASPARARQSRTISALAARTLGLRVLVAEDNLINQEVTMGMLTEAWAATATCVADGRQVLEALASGRLRSGLDGLPDAGDGRVRVHARAAGAARPTARRGSPSSR